MNAGAFAIRLYGLLARCLLPAGLVYLWWRGRKDADYRARWAERLGMAPVPPALRGGTVFHCASVGEVLSARPLIEALLAEPHAGPLVITCTTPTGARMVQERYGAHPGGRVLHCWFPLDTPGATRRFLQAWQPRRVLLMERELWPAFLHQAAHAGVPVVLVNARLSERSAATYQRWHRLMRPLLASLRRVCAEDATVAGRFTALGVSPERVCTTGNLKSDLVVGGAPGGKNGDTNGDTNGSADEGTNGGTNGETIAATRGDSTGGAGGGPVGGALGNAHAQQVARIRQALGTRTVLTAGSTHPGEDEALLEAFGRHLQGAADTLLILVPRHPERFEPVAQLAARAGLRVARRSAQPLPGADTQVWLVDAMGELLRWYGAADACFVGGSLIARGGHNPLEVLAQARPLLTGPHTHNFEPLCSELASAGALLRVADAEAVFSALRALCSDPQRARDLAARGLAAFQRLRGATERTLQALQHACPAPQALPVVPLESHGGGVATWVHPGHFGQADPQLLDAAWWAAQAGGGHPEGSRRAGRGQVHFVTRAGREYLLRHYHRGGLMARISRDLFALQPVRRSRAMAEFSLLSDLRVRGLPVPVPCAARRTRHLLFWYRADILVERIPDATDVARLLHTERALGPTEWQALGRAIRRLHDEQVHHSDLNCHNLLLDAHGAAWIVDFDKCGPRAGEDWKRRNLERLLRSLRKEARLDAAFRWQESDWAPLMQGYAGALPPGAALPA
jgi:3-deoxy-D-manno-octulosonic-acid transferase